MISSVNTDRRGTDSLVEEELEQIRKHLSASCYTSLRNVTCETFGKALILRGRVESYYLKQMAQEAVRQLRPDQIIINILIVD